MLQTVRRHIDANACTLDSSSPSQATSNASTLIVKIQTLTTISRKSNATRVSHLTRPARGQGDNARVLWIHTSGHASLALEGNKMPLAKTDGRTGPHRRQPPRRWGGNRNHRGDEQTFPLTELFQPFPLPRCMEQHRRGVEPLW